MTIKIQSTFYNSDQTSEAWLTQLATGKSRLITLVHPGYQYIPGINATMEARGFRVNLR